MRTSISRRNVSAIGVSIWRGSKTLAELTALTLNHRKSSVLQSDGSAVWERMATAYKSPESEISGWFCMAMWCREGATVGAIVKVVLCKPQSQTGGARYSYARTSKSRGYHLEKASWYVCLVCVFDARSI